MATPRKGYDQLNVLIASETKAALKKMCIDFKENLSLYVEMLIERDLEKNGYSTKGDDAYARRG